MNEVNDTNTASVCLGYCDEIDWLVNIINVLLEILEAWKSKIETLANFSDNPFPGAFLLSSHGGRSEGAL